MFTLNCRGRLVTAQHPLVMGIINVTPDSFYAGSRQMQTDDVLRQAEKMVRDGADIIDMGAQSTRPGADWLAAEDELMRLSDVMAALGARLPGTIFSIDTFYSRVALACAEAGASMVNDISGGRLDPDMLATVASLKMPYVCMHMRGTPQDMQSHTDYEDLVLDVMDYFIKRVEACRAAGIHDVLIDPGFGFSKTIAQNFLLLNNLRALSVIGRPILVGLSRKATVYKTLGTTAAEALNGTTVLNTIALMNGAAVLRVHDVKEARECVRLYSEMHGG